MALIAFYCCCWCFAASAACPSCVLLLLVMVNVASHMLLGPEEAVCHTLLNLISDR